MIYLAYTFIVPADYTEAQILAAGAGCEQPAVTAGVPPLLSGVLQEEDLPALVTETIEIALGHYILDLGDGDFFEYDDWYEVSHLWDIEPQIACALEE